MAYTFVSLVLNTIYLVLETFYSLGIFLADAGNLFAVKLLFGIYLGYFTVSFIL